MLGASRDGTEDVSVPTEAEVRAQYDRILSSPEFHAPNRARAFVSYILNEALAGRSDRLKAYSIALEVFGRESSFDAQNDPVVRIEAGRMRRALERYYLVAGQDDPVFISIPKGGYVPAFRYARSNVSPGQEIEPAPATKPDLSIQSDESVPRRRGNWIWIAAALGAAVLLPALWSVLAGSSVKDIERLVRLAPGSDLNSVDMPRIVVEPFEDLSGSPQAAAIARGLTDEVIGQLSKFREIVVIAGGSRGETEPSLVGQSPARYVLQGRVRLDDDTLRLTTRFLNNADGSVIWANNYDKQFSVREMLEVQTDVAKSVAVAIAQPSGIVFQTDAARIDEQLPEDRDSYACTLAYYAYRGTLEPQKHASARDCLKHATERFPQYSTFWALLSMAYVDEVRFQYRLQTAPGPSLERAEIAAEKAVALDPQNVRALEAQMLVYFFKGDIEAALRTGAEALALNSNDTELAGEYGFRLALSGKWESGCELLSGAISRINGPIGYYELGLATCAYMRGDYKAAEVWARMADLRYNPIHHLVLLSALGAQGKIAAARTEREWFERNAPGILLNVRQEVSTRIQRPEDREHFLDGVRAAGIAVPPN